VAVIPREQAAAVGANIRALRRGKGWTQAQVGELMGWISNSTVCAAEGRRAVGSGASPPLRITPCPRPWATLAARVAAIPKPSSHRASAGTGVLRRAESSITIELV